MTASAADLWPVSPCYTGTACPRCGYAALDVDAAGGRWCRLCGYRPEPPENEICAESEPDLEMDVIRDYCLCRKDAP